MQRIIIHHTAGTYVANDTDKKSYHYLVEKNGNIKNGIYTPADNLNCSDGKYAAHTYKGNTGSIGIAACCNYGFSLKDKQTMYPLRKEQFKTICNLCKRLARTYGIPRDKIYTHWGFDKEKGIRQGKIDITFIPWKPELKPDEVQEYFRHHIMDV